MLFRLQTPSANTLSRSGFYKIAEKMRIDPMLVSLTFHNVLEIVWSSPRGFDDIFRKN